MKQILTITIYELKKNIRDIKMLSILIIFPIILIFILGKSLDSFLTLDYLEKPVVGYVNLDEGNQSLSFNDFLNEEAVKEIITIKEYPNLDSAKDANELGEITSIILIEADYSQKLMNEERVQINILGKKDTMYTEAVVNQYANMHNLVTALINNQLTPQLKNSENLLVREALNDDMIAPSSMDYYAVQTLLQLLLLSAVFGISITLRDYSDGMHLRMSSMPIKKHHIFLGRLIGSIFYSLVATLVTVLFSKFVYHANLDGNMFIISLALLMFIVIAVGLGVIFAHLTKSYVSSFGILAVISMVFPTAAGAFSPKTTIKAVAMISPNHYAKNIIFGTIFDFPQSVILNGFLGLVVMTLVIYGIILYLEGRKKYEHFQ